MAANTEYLYILLIVDGEVRCHDGPGRIPMMFAERDEAVHAAQDARGRDVVLEYYDGRHHLVQREVIAEQGNLNEDA